MKKYLLIVFLLSSFGVAAQSADTDAQLKKVSNASIKLAKNAAQKDITNKNINLFLQGGIAPVTTAADRSFAEKYHLEIIEYGCVGLDRLYSATYNHEIFKFLDKQYGKTWRDEIRDDMIGLKDYIATQ